PLSVAWFLSRRFAHDPRLHSFPTRRSSDLFADTDRLVLIGEELSAFGGGNNGTISAPEYLDYKTLNGRALASSAIYDNAPFVLTDRKSTRLNSSHLGISYAVFCLKKKKLKA